MPLLMALFLLLTQHCLTSPAVSVDRPPTPSPHPEPDCIPAASVGHSAPPTHTPSGATALVGVGYGSRDNALRYQVNSPAAPAVMESDAKLEGPESESDSTLLADLESVEAESKPSTAATLQATPEADVLTNPPFSSSCLCCNSTAGNISITVFGTAMTVTGSAARLNLTWVTARCPSVTSLTLRVGAEAVVGDATASSRIVELDFSENMLDTVPEGVGKMEGLRRLNLARNNISNLPRKVWERMFHRLDSVDIAGNPLRCSRGLAWLEEVPFLQHWDQMTCVGARRDPFGRRDLKPLHKVIDEIRRMDASCPADCRCRLDNLLPTQITVDCAGVRLRNLPTSLPHGVTTLNVSNNQIDSAPLRSLLTANPTLSTIDLSHNQLTAVTPADLRYSGHLGQLDLRHNQLARLPWGELEHALRSESLGVVFLSKNPWSCQRKQQTMQFWRFLVGHKDAVLDFRDVLCAEDGTVHAGKQLVTILTEGNAWRRRQRPDPLDLLIAVEVLLLLCLGAKFGRDVYHHQRTGHHQLIVIWPQQTRRPHG